ncbi:MAG: aspartate--ammonia ligase [Christensenellaceae bacterium]|nr:aspartate--ammonia ligase [Christensenellaceae bacterium]
MSLKRLIVPEGYKPSLSVRETEHAIKKIKDRFEMELAAELNLYRISAPLYLLADSGLNDNLNGVERPVVFDIRELGQEVEIVHSLAKWKRVALKKYGFLPGEGIYTDMNAIRRDEDLDNIHSVYVDQWDWEVILSPENRNVETLKNIVRGIYSALKKTEEYLQTIYPRLKTTLPERIHFVTTQELEDRWPGMTAKEREDAIAKEKGAVFLMGIGGKLASGKPHDGRAPDYDDWSLNGDILLYYPLLGHALEISSMGIRVDAQALAKQLEESGCRDRAKLPFHKALLAGELPLTAGGGIGQSRLCMFLLHKAHIGEVQASVWSEEMVDLCHAHHIDLL